MSIIKLKALRAIFIYIATSIHVFFVKVFLPSSSAYFFNILWYCLVIISLKKTTYLHKIKEKICCKSKDLLCDFLFQYPIEMFLSIHNVKVSSSHSLLPQKKLFIFSCITPQFNFKLRIWNCLPMAIYIDKVEAAQ